MLLSKPYNKKLGAQFEGITASFLLYSRSWHITVGLCNAVYVEYAVLPLVGWSPCRGRLDYQRCA